MSYDIGYGKPPKHTRFKKGQTGNPKGRSKGIRNIATDVKETLARKVTVTEGGRTRTVSTQEAIVLRLAEQALKGDRHAMSQSLILAERYNREELEAASQKFTSLTDAAAIARFGERYKRQQEQTPETPSKGEDDEDFLR
jgi:hypothetical protein